MSNEKRDYLARAVLSQRIKDLFREQVDWKEMSSDEKESLDTIALATATLCNLPDGIPRSFVWKELQEMSGHMLEVYGEPKYPIPQIMVDSVKDQPGLYEYVLTFSVNEIGEFDFQCDAIRDLESSESKVGSADEDDLVGAVAALRARNKEAAAYEDGWIKWDGGPCPLANDSFVDVILRSATVYLARTAQHCRWCHSDPDTLNHLGDIIAYRPREISN